MRLFLAVSAVLLAVALGTAARSATSPPVVTDNQRLMKVDLMVVTAHPDDEGMVAATMARYALDGGRRVALVTATRGEGGGNSTGKEYGPSLGIVREAELRACVDVLGVQYLCFLDRRDFAYTESATATLECWSHGESLRRLVRLVRVMRPEVIVTMDPAPRGGQHGNHQVAGRLATEAFEAAADPTVFPEQIRDEGLTPWRVRKLYYGTRGEGALSLPTDTVSRARGKSYGEIARDALRHHRSQGFDRFMGVGPVRGSRPESFLLVKSRVNTPPGGEKDLFDGCDDPAVAVTELRAAPERDAVAAGQPSQVSVSLANLGGEALRDLHLALTPPASAEGWRVRPLEAAERAELAAGQSWRARFEVTPAGFAPGSVALLEAAASWDGGAGRRTAITHVRSAPPVEVAIRASEQLREYRGWARSQGLDWLVGRLPARVPLTIGATSPVRVDVINRTARPVSGGLRLSVPAGWIVSPVVARYALGPPHAMQTITFQVKLPSGLPQGDHEIQVVSVEGGARDVASAETLPRLVARRLPSAMPVDADPYKWQSAGVVAAAIPATALVQGEVSGPSEASARFFVGYDAQAIRVLVDVTDDTIVTNIAPDDIRGHWRTTSVEITLDPAPRAENTLRTLKLGIFPQDITGRARAARDADANQGPVERVDPGIRLASRRTATGYVVEARIPFASLPRIDGKPFRPAPGRALGFNVILYHAGKKDAALGEDVNKARLAWAYRPGVWGRPASWGTLVLE
jgi:LmbE family N-acetylglucosaminyl deacetylase